MDRRKIGLDPLCGQGGAHNVNLPVSHEGIRGRLKLTPAAGFEMAAGRFHPHVGGVLDADVGQARALQRTGHDLAGQGQRREIGQRMGQVTFGIGHVEQRDVDAVGGGMAHGSDFLSKRGTLSVRLPRRGATGKAVPGFDVSVIDESGKVTDGEGDIAVHCGAASMMLEYWNKPEATAEKFRGDWLVTGDRGVMEGDFIRFLGREDDVISSGGYRIGPAEIEDCLMTHAAVATVGVVGKPDPLRTEIVKAYVVLRPGAMVAGSDLQIWVKDRLAQHCYPREIAFVDALPMTVTGKVIRKELKARAGAEL